jgi:hypothetical protein
MLVLALALLLTPPADAAPTPAAQPAPASAAASPDAAKRPRAQSDLVCRDVTPVGTRFSKRVCTSRSDWEERSRRDQEFIRTTRTAPTPNN